MKIFAAVSAAGLLFALTSGGCSGTSGDDSLTRRYFGYTETIVQANDPSVRETLNWGFGCDSESFMLGYSKEKRVTLPKGEGLYVYVAADVPSGEILRVLREAGIGDAVLITEKTTDNNHEQDTMGTNMDGMRDAKRVPTP